MAYQDYNFQPYVAPFVGGLADTVKNISKELQDVYDENMAKDMQRKVMFANIKTLEGDDFGKKQVADNMDRIIGTVAKSVADGKLEYETASATVANATAEMLTNPVFLAEQESYKEAMKWKNVSDEIRAKGGTPLEFKSYDNHKTFDPETGKVNIYQGNYENKLNWNQDAESLFNNLQASGYSKEDIDLTLQEMEGMIAKGKSQVTTGYQGVNASKTVNTGLLDRFKETAGGSQMYRALTSGVNTETGRKDQPALSEQEAQKVMLNYLKSTAKEFDWSRSSSKSISGLYDIKKAQSMSGSGGLSNSGMTPIYENFMAQSTGSDANQIASKLFPKSANGKEGYYDVPTGTNIVVPNDDGTTSVGTVPMVVEFSKGQLNKLQAYIAQRLKDNPNFDWISEVKKIQESKEPENIDTNQVEKNTNNFLKQRGYTGITNPQVYTVRLDQDREDEHATKNVRINFDSGGITYTIKKEDGEIRLYDDDGNKLTTGQPFLLETAKKMWNESVPKRTEGGDKELEKMIFDENGKPTIGLKNIKKPSISATIGNNHLNVRTKIGDQDATIKYIQGEIPVDEISDEGDLKSSVYTYDKSDKDGVKSKHTEVWIPKPYSFVDAANINKGFNTDKQLAEAGYNPQTSLQYLKGATGSNRKATPEQEAAAKNIQEYNSVSYLLKQSNIENKGQLSQDLQDAYSKLTEGVVKGVDAATQMQLYNNYLQQLNKAKQSLPTQ